MHKTAPAAAAAAAAFGVGGVADVVVVIIRIIVSLRVAVINCCDVVYINLCNALLRVRLLPGIRLAAWHR